MSLESQAFSASPVHSCKTIVGYLTDINLYVFSVIQVMGYYSNGKSKTARLVEDFMKMFHLSSETNPPSHITSRQTFFGRTMSQRRKGVCNAPSAF